VAIEHLSKVNPCGNSFMVIVPKRYISALGMKPKDYMILRLTGGIITLRPYERNEQCRAT